MCSQGYYSKYVQDQNSQASYYYCAPVTASMAQVPEGTTHACTMFGNTLFESGLIGFGCVQCQEGFIVVGGACVANLMQSQYSCNIDNCEYCIANNYCGQCAEGFTVYTYTGGSCMPIYSPVPNCMVSSGTYCLPCGDGYLAFSGGCQRINQEITCNMTGCSYCVENNTCAKCMPGFKAMYI